MKTIYIPANKLIKGMIFEQSETSCYIVSTKKNHFGQTVVRFVSDTDNTLRIKYMTVQGNSIFKVQKQ